MMITIRHFSPREFRCKCCGQGGIDAALALILDGLRAAIKKPIVVTSGYRCPKHNIEVGGIPDSRHLYGLAADIACPSMQYAPFAEMCIAFFRREGWECVLYPKKNFVHVAIPRGYDPQIWTGGDIYVKC